MAQFDVHPNPVLAARPAYPWVVVLQADATAGGRERVVAPLVATARLRASPGRLLPTVRIDGESFAVVVPALATVRTRDLHSPAHSPARARESVLAALDLLFSGT